MPKRSLYIAGAGGLGRETAILIERITSAVPTSQRWSFDGFVDDNPDLHHQTVLGYPIRGAVDCLVTRRNAFYVVAIGASSARERVVHRLQGAACTLAPPLIDPDVFVHASTSVGAGSLIYRGAVVMAASTLGQSVIVDANATVGHDASIGDFVTIHPGANLAGGVAIASGVQLGAGCTVLPGVSIGRNARIGAGAVVTRDLPAGCTAVGVPARPLDR